MYIYANIYIEEQMFTSIYAPVQFIFFIQMTIPFVSTNHTCKVPAWPVWRPVPPLQPSNRCRRTIPWGMIHPVKAVCSSKLMHPKPRIETETIHQLCFLGSSRTSQPPGRRGWNISCEKPVPVNNLRKINWFMSHPALTKQYRGARR